MPGLDGAQAVVERGRRAAEALGLAMTIAVVDDGGHLVAFARMDGAKFVTVGMATGKAWTAASAGIGGTALMALLESSPRVAPAFATATGGRFLAAPGGVPLPGGGAVGVSGGSEDQDEHVARAAAGDG